MKKIAFICNHNSCRSQIAEYFAKKYLKNNFEIYSAGSNIKDKIDENVVNIIKKLYNDDILLTQYPKKISDIPEPDIIISMGCINGCPFTSRSFDDNWHINDPSGLAVNKYLETFSLIENKVIELSKKLYS